MNSYELIENKSIHSKFLELYLLYNYYNNIKMSDKIEKTAF